MAEFVHYIPLRGLDQFMFASPFKPPCEPVLHVVLTRSLRIVTQMLDLIDEPLPFIGRRRTDVLHFLPNRCRQHVFLAV